MERKMVEQDTLDHSTSPEGNRIRVQLSEYQKRGLWLRWILATALGATGGSAIFQALRQRSFSFAWIVGLGLFGLAIGLAQSLVLERLFRQSSKLIQIGLFCQWTLTCSIGWVTGGLASFVVPVAAWLFLAFTVNVDYTWIHRPGYYVHWGSLISLGALAVSIVQRRILHTRINSVAEWVRTSIIGWIVAWAVGLGVVHITPGSELVKAAVGGVIWGAIVGALTGYALVRLLADSARR